LGRLSELLNLVERGEVVVIAKAERPAGLRTGGHIVVTGQPAGPRKIG
jgi:hypothetical protein